MPIADQITEARKQGYSDDEISGFLEQSHPDLAPKIKEAKTHGYAAGEVLGYLSKAPDSKYAIKPESTYMEKANSWLKENHPDVYSALESAITIPERGADQLSRAVFGHDKGQKTQNSPQARVADAIEGVSTLASPLLLDAPGGGYVKKAVAGVLGSAVGSKTGEVVADASGAGEDTKRMVSDLGAVAGGVAGAGAQGARESTAAAADTRTAILDRMGVAEPPKPAKTTIPPGLIDKVVSKVANKHPMLKGAKILYDVGKAYHEALQEANEPGTAAETPVPEAPSPAVQSEVLPPSRQPGAGSIITEPPAVAGIPPEGSVSRGTQPVDTRTFQQIVNEKGGKPIDQAPMVGPPNPNPTRIAENVSRGTGVSSGIEKQAGSNVVPIAQAPVNLNPQQLAAAEALRDAIQPDGPPKPAAGSLSSAAYEADARHLKSEAVAQKLFENGVSAADLKLLEHDNPMWTQLFESVGEHGPGKYSGDPVATIEQTLVKLQKLQRPAKVMKAPAVAPAPEPQPGQMNARALEIAQALADEMNNAGEGSGTVGNAMKRTRRK